MSILRTSMHLILQNELSYTILHTMINNFKFDVGFYKTNFNKQKPGGKKLKSKCDTTFRSAASTENWIPFLF